MASTFFSLPHLQARDHLQQAGQLGTGSSIATAHGPREIALGDRVVCTRNSRHHAVRNGQLGTVEAMTGMGRNTVLHLRLDDGQRRVKLPIQHYPHLDHGYALTTHKAQGVTVDHAFVLVGGRLADREIGLVQLSRHRESAHLFVDRCYYEAQRPEHGPDRAARHAPDASTQVAPQPAPITAPERMPPLDHAATVRQTIDALATQLQVSHQKDTTQDYRPRQPSQGQGLE